MRAVGGDLAAAGLALAELKGLDGRGKRHRIELKDGSKALLIDESYNANPVSMKATLAQLGAERCDGKKIAVLGAMGELGDKAEFYHRALAEDIIASGAKVVILVGDEMAYTSARLAELVSEKLDHIPEITHVAGSSEAAITTMLTGIARVIGGDDILLVKGSNYLGLAKLVSALVSGEY